MGDSSSGVPQSPPSAVVAPPADPSGWTVADTETVSCCVCGVDGTVLYRLPPFGVVRCPICELVFVSPRLTSAALQRLYDEPAYFEGGVYGAQSPWSPAMVLQRTWTAGRLAAITRLRPPPARLLEIGSGYGLFLAEARRAGFDVRGVELSRTVAGARDDCWEEIIRRQIKAHFLRLSQLVHSWRNEIPFSAEFKAAVGQAVRFFPSLADQVELFYAAVDEQRTPARVECMMRSLLELRIAVQRTSALDVLGA